MTEEQFERLLESVDAVAGSSTDWLLAAVPLAALIASISFWMMDRKLLREQISEGDKRAALAMRPGVAAVVQSHREESYRIGTKGMSGPMADVRLTNLGPGVATCVEVRPRFIEGEPIGWIADVVSMPVGGSPRVLLPYDGPVREIDGIEVRCADVEGREYVCTTLGSSNVVVQTVAEHRIAPPAVRPVRPDRPVARLDP